MLIVHILIIGLCVFLFFKIRAKFKAIITGCLTVIDGGLKCGKSTLLTYLGLREYNAIHRSWKIKNFICKIFKKQPPEEPVLVSNIPLACKYTPLTLDILMRKVRLPYKSVVIINEGSLLADSKLIFDEEVNKNILLFFKLFGHETKGGKCFIDSQQISDLHFGIKRSISNYIYIHSLTKWVPFILIANVRELLHNEDGDIMNNFNEDIENSMKKVIFFKSIWKKFDAYCYSSLTDKLPVYYDFIDNRTAVAEDLKIKNLVSFRPEYNIQVEDLEKNIKVVKYEKKE